MMNPEDNSGAAAADAPVEVGAVEADEALHEHLAGQETKAKARCEHDHRRLYTTKEQAHQMGLFKRPMPALDQAEVLRFLSHVALGNQDAAEAMLKGNPKLTLGKGGCSDHARRGFNGITGFQYALWALDWHMWDMILGYLEEVDPEAARQQCQEQEALTKRCGHGERYDFEELLGALKHFIDEYDRLDQARNRRGLDRLWEGGVGIAQMKTVAHVRHEYCYPGRTFKPMPDFTQKPLLRQISDWRLELGWWWISGCKCAWNGGHEGVDGVTADHAALSKLFEVRMSQLRETQLNLLSCVDRQAP